MTEDTASRVEDTFSPTWLIKDPGELELLKDYGQFGKRVIALNRGVRFHDTNTWRGGFLYLSEQCSEDDVPDSHAAEVLGRISLHVQNLDDKEKERVAQQVADTKDAVADAVAPVVEGQKKILAEQKKQTAIQTKDQALNAARGGFAGLIAAMDAQVGFEPKEFFNNTPPWYNDMSPTWQQVILANIGTLVGADIKRKDLGGGAAELSASKEIHIDRKALAEMWTHMPGFRIALATIVDENFDEDQQTMTLTEDGIENLGDIKGYKEGLIRKLAMHLQTNKHLLNTTNGPVFANSEQAARYAVSSAWSLVFLGGAVDSGDLGRELGDVSVYNSSVRTLCMPRIQAAKKYVQKEVDTEGFDETWGGRTGEWFSERIRHSMQPGTRSGTLVPIPGGFADQFMRNQGVTRLIPERMLYSLFDQTGFDTRDVDDVARIAQEIRNADWRPVNNGDSLTLSAVLIGARKSDVVVRGPDNLKDYTNPDAIDLNMLQFSELWGGYADSMDSALKIYGAVTGSVPEGFNVNQLTNALSKVKKNPLLRPLYTGESGYWIVASSLVSMLGGPIKYSNEIVLALQEGVYDNTVHHSLNDDRLFAGLGDPRDTRKKLLKLFNATSLDSVRGVLASVFRSDSAMLGGRRAQLKRMAAEENRRWLGS